jgi:predicted patatin/cPLA2 family phospholipase
MPGLVLEGGSFRGIFSAGVMDALLEEDIMFPYCVGVSAGISNAISYLSRQPGRNLDVLIKYRHDNRYISRRNFLRCRSLFGLDFIFDEIPNHLVPFDWDTFHAYKGTAYAVVTNARTGEAEYLNCQELDSRCQILRATCALPLAFPPIKWKGEEYFDGGLSDSIPIQRSIADGNAMNLIVLTQPAGFRKVYAKEYDMAIRFFGKKYPRLVDVLKTRHIHYNETQDYCDQLESEGKAIIIRPSYKLDSMEKDLGRLRANYQHGFDLTRERIRGIQRIF